jgi:phospholipid N-methyltransferase
LSDFFVADEIDSGYESALVETDQPRETDGRMSSQRSRSRLSDLWLFFSKFCRQGTSVGSIVPSSGPFARRMVTDIEWSQARCIVELGAGIGAVTAELLRQKSRTCHCLIIERDADFCARLHERFPDAEVINADACELDRLLIDRNIESVDHILCGLGQTLPDLGAGVRERRRPRKGCS